MDRTAQDAMAPKAKVEQRSPWPTPFFSQLQTMPRFAELPRMEYPVLQCPPLRRAQVECSPISRSMPWCEESDHGRSPTLLAKRLRRLMRRLLAIRNVAPMHIELTAPLVTERMATEAARPARS